MQETQVQSLGWEDPLEKGMQPTPYPCLENSMNREPGRLQSTRSQKVGHNWATNAYTRAIHCRKISLFKKMVLEQLYIHMQKKKRIHTQTFTPHKNSN